VSFLNNYGEVVDGYSVRVLNEREARAAAGILFTLGLISVMNSLMLGVAFLSQLFVALFTIDFLIRVINPRYAPSLLLGRFFVQNQTPEYVGAMQKRFAWMIGLVLALPMFYFVSLHFTPGMWKVFICILCLVLLIMESAFSICVGCWLYAKITKKPIQYCPGDVCEIRVKEPIVKFSLLQGLIATVTAVAIVVSIAYYTVTFEDKTFFMKRLKEKFMSDEALDKKAFNKALDEFDNDDDF